MKIDEKELPKAFEPAKYEDAIYEKWEKSGFFNPDNLKGEPFSIMMPPPNVTGVLHLGHALENSLMDTMARYQRMRGKKVLLLPGTDHAAVATQAKVEKVLVEQGIKNPRQELGREKLLEKIREYAENSKSTILKQIRKMGTSCDWSRLAYTFDEARSRAVNEVFVKMYEDGLIYRGYRVVNWSVKGQSTASDDELVHIERPGKLYTFKYSKDFPLSIATTRPETKLGDTAVAVHPEDERYQKYIGQTFKADVGAAQPLEIKIIANENVDPKFGTGAIGVTPAHSAVDFEMYEKQKAKGEPIDLIQVIGPDGRMTAAAGKTYAGLTALEAREKFILWLKENNLLEKEEEIMQNVGTSDRFGDVVEALPMTQWFVDVNKEIPGRGKSLKDLMREAVATGHKGDPKQKINITPERFEKIYFNWIDNLRDWCISRQIWWGHRIPVYYRKQEIFNSQFSISNKENSEEIYVGTEMPEGEGWVQDEDTLDTWFSSGLWTFSTLGWPWQKVWDLKIYDGEQIFDALKSGKKRFETRAGKPEGVEKDWREFKVGDIVNFSLVEEGTEKVLSNKIVTKQIVSIQHFDSLNALLEKIDVNEVHPYKSEEYRIWWEKRPQFKERIEKYGIWAFELKDPDLSLYHPTSWMQMGYEILFFWMARMILMSTYALDEIPFYNVYIHGILRDETGKKFSKSAGNSVDPLEVIKEFGTDALRLSLLTGVTPGNDARFYEEKVEGARNLVNKLWNISRYIIGNYQLPITNYQLKFENLSLADKMILEKLTRTIHDITNDLDNYRFSQAGEVLRSFTWDDFADWYLEICKFEKNEEKSNILYLILHNLLKLWHPFIPFITEAIWSEFNNTMLMAETWPLEIIHEQIGLNEANSYEFETVKNIISAIRNARSANKIPPAKKIKAVIYAGENKDLIESQSILVKNLRTGVEELEIKEGGEKIENAILLTVGNIEVYLVGAVDEEKEKERIKKEKENLENYIKTLKIKLSNKEFVARAPEKIIEQEKAKLEKAEKELEALSKIS